jgi:DNA-binding XRE family transcriptional regulator
MPRTLDQVIDGLAADERAEVEARTRELIAEETSLRALRRALGRTQAALANEMNVGQEAVSKIESRGDMYVSTLREFIAALGGELELSAQFPGRPPVRLGGLGEASVRRRRHSHSRYNRGKAAAE